MDNRSRGLKKTKKSTRSRSEPDRSRSRSRSSSETRSRGRVSERSTPARRREDRQFETPARRAAMDTAPPARQSPGLVSRSDIWSELQGLNKRVDDLSETLNAKLDTIMEKLDQRESTGIKPNKIPPELAASVKTIYRGLGADRKWKLSEPFRSPDNESITKAVLQALKDDECEWSTSLIRKASNRAFENAKAQYKMELEGTMEDVKRRKALTSRRDRLFKKRVTVGQKILSTEDLNYLTNCDPNFVSDEETDEDKTTFKVKSPKWRAARLSGIMEACQKALDDNRKKAVEPKSTHARNNYGEFSRRAPPAAEEKLVYILHNEEASGSADLSAAE